MNHTFGKVNRLGNAIAGQVDADELGPFKAANRIHVDAAGVQRPQPILGIDNRALHRQERIWRVAHVDRRIGERNFLIAAQLNERGRGRIFPARERHKDSAIARYRHARRHRAAEIVNNLQIARSYGFGRRVERLLGSRGGRVILATDQK